MSTKVDIFMDTIAVSPERQKLICFTCLWRVGCIQLEGLPRECFFARGEGEKEHVDANALEAR
jgi:hypothetical protein